MKANGVRVERHRPRIRVGRRPQAVRPRRQRLAVHQQRLRRREPGRGVRAWRPHAAERDERAEQRATARHRPAIDDLDPRIRDVLRDDAELRFGSGGLRAGGRRTGERVERMQLADTATYLPDDILQKVDRAAMAVALEVRPPLLDHRVVEFAWTLPRHMRIRKGETKWLLRRVLDRYVPRALIDRPKMGFAVPLSDWLRGPLRDWAEDLLDPSRMRQDGFLDGARVQGRWRDTLEGRRNGSGSIWAILMFQAWLRSTSESSVGAEVRSNAA